MKMLKKKEGLDNCVYFLDGLYNGILSTLFVGPIFIIGLLTNWLVLLIFLAACLLFYYGTKYFINNKQLIKGKGNSEIWWLGGLVGFCYVMLIFFSILSLPIG